MKNILFILITSTLLFSITGCGGGGSSSSTGDDSNTTTISISNCPTYTDILSGDKIVSDSLGTSIQTIFNTDGSEQICILSGAAHIER